jgi:glycerol uptake facilitator-like aquaporin
MVGAIVAAGLLLVIAMGIPVNNLSVNPARSIGPALFVGR